MLNMFPKVRRDLNILAGFVNDFLRSAISRFRKTDRRLDQLSAENKNIRRSLGHLNERIERVRAVQASDDAVVRSRIDGLRRDLGSVPPVDVPKTVEEYILGDALPCKMSIVNKEELKDWEKTVEKVTKKAKKGRKGKKS